MAGISVTCRKIKRLSDLQPGDHIRVPAYGKNIFGSSSRSSGSKRAYTHHLMVIEVKEETIEVIHKTKNKGVKEDDMHYKASEITVLEYKCDYTGHEAIKRARQLAYEKYNVLIGNCEQFVFEARTGKKQSEQLFIAAVGGWTGGISGAIAGSGAGATIGAIIGGVLGSIIPGAGTAAGAVIGGAVGGGVGATVGTGSGVAGGSAVGLKWFNSD